MILSELPRPAIRVVQLLRCHSTFHLGFQIWWHCRASDYSQFDDGLECESHSEQPIGRLLACYIHQVVGAEQCMDYSLSRHLGVFYVVLLRYHRSFLIPRTPSASSTDPCTSSLGLVFSMSHSLSFGLLSVVVTGTSSKPSGQSSLAVTVHLVSEKLSSNYSPLYLPIVGSWMVSRLAWWLIWCLPSRTAHKWWAGGKGSETKLFF